MSQAARSNLPASQIYTLSFEWFGRNTPDLYCFSPLCNSFWIELKQVPSSNCVLPFRKGQPEWLDVHQAGGGSAFILVLVGEETLFLLRAKNVRWLKTQKLRDSGDWIIGEISLLRPFPWDDLANLVLNSLANKKQASRRPLAD